MNKYVTFLSFFACSHAIRCISDYVYYTQCVGFWNSIFTWNSLTCRGLRWAADSTMTNVGVQVTKLLEF